MQCCRGRSRLRDVPRCPQSGQGPSCPLHRPSCPQARAPAPPCPVHKPQGLPWLRDAKTTPCSTGGARGCCGRRRALVSAPSPHHVSGLGAGSEDPRPLPKVLARLGDGPCRSPRAQSCRSPELLHGGRANESPGRSRAQGPGSKQGCCYAASSCLEKHPLLPQGCAARWSQRLAARGRGWGCREPHATRGLEAW